MKKRLTRRRAVSSMIAGVIVLGLLLTALVTMVLLTEQYDSYQRTVNAMKLADMNRFSENLGFVVPGLTKYQSNPRALPGTPCSGGCNMYTIILDDMASNSSADIGVQITRIYINSSTVYSQSGCVSLCVLGPSTMPSPYVFNSSQRFINAGEYQHNVIIWLPSSVILPESDSSGNQAYSLNTVSVITGRGRQFSFQWPVPPTGLSSGSTGGSAGGTGLYIGPLVITFQKTLISYSTIPNTITTPIGGSTGYWVMPTPTFVVYVKIQTDRGTPSDVYLTAQTVLELARFNSPGNVFSFFIVAPITVSFCNKFEALDSTIICDSSYGYYANGNQGSPGSLVAYSSCSTMPYSSCPNRYKIPAPTTQQLLNNQRGNPVIVAFAASTASGTMPQTGAGGFSNGQFATSFLGLTYVYNDQTGFGDYTYAVTLPFIAVCFDNANSNGSSSPCGI